MSGVYASGLVFSGAGFADTGAALAQLSATGHTAAAVSLCVVQQSLLQGTAGGDRAVRNFADAVDEFVRTSDPQAAMRMLQERVADSMAALGNVRWTGAFSRIPMKPSVVPDEGGGGCPCAPPEETMVMPRAGPDVFASAWVGNGDTGNTGKTRQRVPGVGFVCASGGHRTTPGRGRSRTGAPVPGQGARPRGETKLGIPANVVVPSMEQPNEQLLRLSAKFNELRDGSGGKGGIKHYHGVVTRCLDDGRIETAVGALAEISNRLRVFANDFMRQFGDLLDDLNRRREIAGGLPGKAARESVTTRESDLLGDVWHAMHAEAQKLQTAIERAEAAMARHAGGMEKTPSLSDRAKYSLYVLKGDWKRWDLKYFSLAFDVGGWVEVHGEAMTAYDLARRHCIRLKNWRDAYRIEVRKALLLMDAYLFNERMQTSGLGMAVQKDYLLTTIMLDMTAVSAVKKGAHGEALILARTRADILRRVAARMNDRREFDQAIDTLFDSVRQTGLLISKIIRAEDGPAKDKGETKARGLIIPEAIQSEIMADVRLAVEISTNLRDRTGRQKGLIIDVARMLADTYRNVFGDAEWAVSFQRGVMEAEASGAPTVQKNFLPTEFVKAIANQFTIISSLFTTMGDAHNSILAQDWAVKCYSMAVFLENRLALHERLAETARTLARLSEAVRRRRAEANDDLEELAPLGESVPSTLTPIAGVDVAGLGVRATPGPTDDSAPVATWSDGVADLPPASDGGDVVDPTAWFEGTPDKQRPQTPAVPDALPDVTTELMDSAISALDMLGILGIHYKVPSPGHEEGRDADPFEALIRHYHSIRLILATAVNIARAMKTPSIPVGRMAQMAEALEALASSTFAAHSARTEAGEGVDTTLAVRDIGRWVFYEDGEWVDIYKRQGGITTQETITLSAALKKIGLTAGQFDAMKQALAHSASGGN